MTAVSAECKVPQFQLKLTFGSTKTGLVTVKRLPEEECGAFEIPNIQIRPYHQVRIPDDFRKQNLGSLIVQKVEEILRHSWCCSQSLKERYLFDDIF